MSADPVSRGERTRSEILQAARLLFMQGGYHGTSMRQISQEASITLGGIYNHFSGKEEIFTSVLLEGHPFKVILPLMMQAQGETVESFVSDAARRLVDGLDDQRDFLNLIFVELVEFKGQHLHQLLPELFDIYLPQMLEFGERLSSARQELRDIPTPILLRAFLGFFVSYALTELIFAGRFPVEMRAHGLDQFIDIFLHGILTKTPPSEVP
jgi:AcrR family transcriptional regulator